MSNDIIRTAVKYDRLTKNWQAANGEVQDFAPAGPAGARPCWQP
jgi:hypothetical protein